MKLVRLFSKSANSDNSQPKDINALKTSGKIGMTAGTVLGGAAIAEGARSAYHGTKLLKESKNLKNLKNSKPLREEVKKEIRKHAPRASEKIIDKVRLVEKNFPKFNTIDKIEKGLGYWNKTSKLSRTVLDNMENYAGLAKEHVKNKYGKELTKEEINLLDKVPGVAKRLGKTGTALKNAKALGKAGLVLGQAGGLLYLNGRSLESGGNSPIKK